MTLFKGSGVAIVTPFNEKGIDFKSLENLVEWHIAEGTDALIVCGTTGEGSTLTTQEKKETIKFVVDIVKKRIPVIAGTGSNNTAASISLSQWAESVGVDGLLVITPYYNKTNKRGLIEHFKAIDAAVSTPIMVYNVPSRTGMNITPSDLVTLAELENVTSIKEASGDLSQILEMKRLCGDKIDIYSGNDDQIIAVLSVGGIGVVSVLANVVPKETSEMVHLYLDGKVNEALDIQLKTLPLANSLFIETNPIPVKTALNIMGKNVGPLRLPLFEMESQNEEVLKTELSNLDLC